jgi:hypothetical protein
VRGFPLYSRLEFYAQARMPHPDGDDPPGLKVAFTKDEAVVLGAREVEAACFEYQPDVLLVVSGIFTPHWLLDLCRARGILVAALLTEQPYELGRELALAEHCDLVVLNDPAHLDRFREVSAAYYQPHCYDPGRHHPGPGRAEWACDVAFVGTAFASRLRFLELVEWPTDSVRLAGMWAQLPEGHRFERWLLNPNRMHCLDNTDTADLYRSTRASFNLYRADDEDGGHGGGGPGWAMGPREVELAACGTWFARHPRPEGDAVLPMLPTITTPDELSDALRWALTHDDARLAAANAARAAVADRTFVNAARRFLGCLERAEQLELAS